MKSFLGFSCRPEAICQKSRKPMLCCRHSLPSHAAVIRCQPSSSLLSFIIVVRYSSYIVIMHRRHACMMRLDEDGDEEHDNKPRFFTYSSTYDTNRHLLLSPLFVTFVCRRRSLPSRAAIIRRQPSSSLLSFIAVVHHSLYIIIMHRQHALPSLIIIIIVCCFFLSPLYGLLFIPIDSHHSSQLSLFVAN